MVENNPTTQNPAPRQNIAVQALFGVRRVCLSSAGIELLVSYVVRLQLSLLSAHRQNYDFPKSCGLRWFVEFYPDNDLKKYAAPLLQAAVGVATATDACLLHLPVRETWLFGCFHTTAVSAYGDSNAVRSGSILPLVSSCSPTCTSSGTSPCLS